MSKYTPGPWTLEIIDGDVWGICGADKNQIVETDGGVYPPKLADAKLISAAPEMADILLRLAKCQWQTDFVGTLAAEARAALAKAGVEL